LYGIIAFFFKVEMERCVNVIALKA